MKKPTLSKMSRPLALQPRRWGPSAGEVTRLAANDARGDQDKPTLDDYLEKVEPKELDPEEKKFLIASLSLAGAVRFAKDKEGVSRGRSLVSFLREHGFEDEVRNMRPEAFTALVDAVYNGTLEFGPVDTPEGQAQRTTLDMSARISLHDKV